MVRNRLFKNEYHKELDKGVAILNWIETVENPNSYVGNNSFCFLNKKKRFGGQIDWNYQDYGKLWTFNINYFDFLNQEIITVETGLKLIKDYIAKDVDLLDGKASYPISLRGINWVKFLAKHKVSDKEIDQSLFNHYQILVKNPEYHLLGNHLLENGFALLFGAYYFKDEILYKEGVKIITSELKEQILQDGGHFELSPMYHQTMLFRVLDCIQLVRLNTWKEDNLASFLEGVAAKMLAWIKEVTFDNGDIPMVNDSAFGIAPSTKELLDYGKQLGIQIPKIKLSDSGYRMFKTKKFELFVDIGHVGASYQPAHVHSDTFNFIVYVDKQPILVDTGLSTYEKNERRQLERSTAAHNTVQIENIEQTQVWGGFRVAKRAEITNIKEDVNGVQATHNGYKELGVEHTRKFNINESEIKILDTISGKLELKQVAIFHLHPSIKEVAVYKSKVFIGNKAVELNFKGEEIMIEKETYKFAAGFNKTSEGIKLKVLFKSKLETTIQI